MSFTVVIPFYNGHEHIHKLLSTIPDNLKVLVIDDLSDKPLFSVAHPNSWIIRLKEKGYFTGAVNAGMELATDDVLILNQDTYFEDDSWLNFINEQTADMFGERAGSHPAWPERYIHGTFMYISRKIIDRIGLMDDKNYPLWGSTCDYQLRACRKGFTAKPLKAIPGFVHKRQGSYGTSIKQLLDKGIDRGKFLSTPPLVSVVITCYNYGRYLPDAIASLIGGETSLGYTEGQTLQSFEVIILDDGSTDNSAEIALKLADPFKGIHFVRQANGGSAKAVNQAIIHSHARKDSLIAVLDGDDMMEPERLETMVKAYKQNPHSVIFDNVQYFGNGQRGVVVDWQTGKRINRLNLKSYDFEQMLQRNKMHKGLLFPKRAWEEAGGYPEIMTKGREDWAFNVALGVNGWCGVNTGEYHYLYRREGQNRTLSNTTPKHHAFFLGQIKSLFPDIYKGVRPVGCCGRPSQGVTKASSSTNGASTMSLPGQDGMVILEYIGSNSGDVTWYGEETKTQYYLGGVTKRGYVDKKDAAGMLALRKRGKPLFKEYTPPKQPKPAVEIQTEVVEFDAESIAAKNVSELKAAIEPLTLSQLEQVLEAEKLNKGRSTAIDAIEAKLNG